MLLSAGCSSPPPRALKPKDLFQSSGEVKPTACATAAVSDLQTGLLPFAEARAAVSGACDSQTVQGPVAKRAKTGEGSGYR